MKKKKKIKETKKKVVRKQPSRSSSTKKGVLSFFVETLKTGGDRWVKGPDYPEDWKEEISDNRKKNLTVLKSLEIPVEVKSLLTICLSKSIRLSEVIYEGYCFPLEVDHEGYSTGKEVTFDNLDEDFEIVEDNHDDSDYKRYYHTDVIHFKKHNLYIREDSEGVHERPPYDLSYSVSKPKKTTRWI